MSTALRRGSPSQCPRVGALLAAEVPIVAVEVSLAALTSFTLLGPLGLVPLPSKWCIEFGEPIDTSALPEDAADDPMLVFNLTDQVRETIQQTLYRLLLHRRSVFR